LVGGLLDSSEDVPTMEIRPFLRFMIKLIKKFGKIKESSFLWPIGPLTCHDSNSLSKIIVFDSFCPDFEAFNIAKGLEWSL
jgi:hypothetical protein